MASINIPQNFHITGSRVIAATSPPQLEGLPVDIRFAFDFISSNGGDTSKTVRNDLTLSKRYEGLICYVRETKKPYILVGGITNSDWKEVCLYEQVVNGITRLRKVISILNTPPTSPSEGDRYIVGSTPTGEWGSDNAVHKIATYTKGDWVYTAPDEGMVVYIDSENKDAIFIDDGTPQWEIRSLASGNHNELSNLQGGSSDNYYHLTSSQVSQVHTHSNSTILNNLSDVEGVLYYDELRVGETFPEATAAGCLIWYNGTQWGLLPSNVSGSVAALLSDASGNLTWGTAGGDLPDVIDGGNLDA